MHSHILTRLQEHWFETHSKNKIYIYKYNIAEKTVAEFNQSFERITLGGLLNA